MSALGRKRTLARLLVNFRFYVCFVPKADTTNYGFILSTLRVFSLNEIISSSMTSKHGNNTSVNGVANKIPYPIANAIGAEKGSEPPIPGIG